MGRNFLRFWSLQVGGVTGPASGPTDLRITFSIRQDTIQDPNPARFRVYNPSASTSAALKAAQGSKVTFSAGYQDSVGVVYSGDMKQFVAGHETPVDSYVDLLCAGGDVAYNQARVTKTLAAGWTPMDKVKVALDAMSPFGVTMGLMNVDLSQPKFSRGIPLIGMARNLLREVALSKGALWSIQTDGLHIVDARQSVQTGVTVLNSQTGLVGWAKQTPDGIIARSLLNAALQPHQQVYLKESDILAAERDVNPLNQGVSAQNINLDRAGVLAPDGVYTIIALNRTGDTRGVEFYDEMTCIASNGGALTDGQQKQGLTLGQG